MTGGLPPALAGFAVEHHGALPSTQDRARELADAGGVDYCVVADVQTAGRGRQGRPWWSPTGNLYASTVIEPAGPTRTWALYSLVVALALAEAVEKVTADTTQRALRPALKWPNDVLIDGAKLAGVLLEVAGTQRAPRLVIGTGVNLASAPPLSLAGQPTIALAAVTGEQVEQTVMLSAFLTGLRCHIHTMATEGFDPARAAWLERAAGLGQEVTIERHGERFLGCFCGLAEDGAIVVRSDHAERSFHAGEVRLRVHGGDV